MEVADQCRFGSKADVTVLNVDVRFTPESGHRSAVWKCPFWATNRHSATVAGGALMRVRRLGGAGDHSPARNLTAMAELEITARFGLVPLALFAFPLHGPVAPWDRAGEAMCRSRGHTFRRPRNSVTSPR